MKKSTFLVTGGAGFIGTHLVKKLLQLKHEVYVLDNLTSGRRENLPAEAKLIIGDIRDERLVKELMKKMDGCFHLAAILSMQECTDDWVGTHSVNSTGAIQIFNAAMHGKDDNPIPVVYASSCAVYGDIKLPLKETSLVKPISPYGADKLACEVNARVATMIYGVPTTGLRIFNVYGPGQDPNSPYAGVISIFLNHAIKNTPMEIFDDGTNVRDFVYIDDVVRFLITSMNKQQPEKANVYNVATGKVIDINNLAKLIIKLTRKKIKPVHINPRKGDIKKSQGDPTLAAKMLGITANTSLQTGLKRLIKHLLQ